MIIARLSSVSGGRWWWCWNARAKCHLVEEVGLMCAEHLFVCERRRQADEDDDDVGCLQFGASSSRGRLRPARLMMDDFISAPAFISRGSGGHRGEHGAEHKYPSSCYLFRLRGRIGALIPDYLSWEGNTCRGFVIFKNRSSVTLTVSLKKRYRWYFITFTYI